MKFTRELSGTLNVRGVGADGIRIGDDLFRHPLAISPQKILGEWPGKAIHKLATDDFETLLSTSPELVLLGTGDASEFPARELMFAFARRGVGLEVMDTPAAARTFNVLAGEGRRVVAVLYLV